MPSSGGSPPAVEVTDLVKRYPASTTAAVDGLSFTVAPGEIFGLLGPNGAGKSTTIGILTTRLRASAGRALVGGVDVVGDPVAARAQLAVVPQHNNLDRSLTPRQNLVYHAAYHGVGRAVRNARADALLDRFGLTDRADKRIEAYSGGMAQRLMIARALIHEPAVLFLDEPTNGLDPQSRRLIWSRIRELRGRGVTVVLTTHQMNAAAALVDRVGIVEHGRLLTLDKPGNLVRGLAGRSILDLTVTPAALDEPDELLRALSEVSGVRKGERLAAAPPPGAGAANLRSGLGLGGGAGFGAGAPAAALAALARRERAVATLAPDPGGRQRVRIRLHLATDPATVLGPALTILTTRSATLTDVHIAEPSLEDVFIGLTGRDPR
ncbi:ABC-2 type transport system ATP-binding protein [Micromonospora pisi]|uniref:ABC-2 type transport system ATP-binding protein n=1 Tax=Micromonospora pisi TaxID=589240 RepID=A0A495JCC9_9ACTN|nr:ABC transporter ATP-binding protein [Micromonospora pisi]RKR86575.1 ABC-2 type transport system ATP-binding protein [Micromonospora pisi]